MKNEIKKHLRQFLIKKELFKFKLKELDLIKILNDLKKEGVFVGNFIDLFDESTFNRLKVEFDSFLLHIENPNINADMGYKTYIKSAEASRFNLPELKKAGSNPKLLKLVKSYMNFPIKLNKVDLWKTIISEDRKNSQNWHCDPEGEKIIKIFIYFNNIDIDNGAFQYVKGTNIKGRNRKKMIGIKSGTPFYPNDEWVNKEFNSDVFTAIGEEGTIVIADTRGLHRGGNCISSERYMGVLSYVDNLSSAKNLLN